ncbi:cupin domain-containing protein [Aquabacterium sp. A7-Y]|uniref:cupin domain-containing protein n=1 Tax=Aquabacterium sp. A7-Y TaxID=1349605 RepID=UPI00223E3AEA|nr:cupin domain-containing protein [Aquabacterium sp. A7-Y]MCW7540080.1 cupin domain-containing protein [Aquabacterium sp. A7-Y]
MSFVQHAQRFSVASVGGFEALLQHRYTHPAIGRPTPGKLFLREAMRLTGLEISLNRLPARAAVPFMHSHRVNEEVYIVIAGEGEFQVDDEIFRVRAGTVVRVDPAAARAWRTTGSEPLDYIVIQAPAGGYAGAGAIDDGVMVDRRPAWAAGVPA